MTKSHKVIVEVQEGDVGEYSADVLVLKYAQSLFGADLAVYERLKELGHEPASLPGVNASILLNTKGLLGAAAVLFIGVVPLRQFSYQQIREFGRKALASVPNVQHLALTIHGPGYGLDEVEAFESELAGVLEALEAGDCPDKLERVSFVERNLGRVSRLREVLSDLIPEGIAELTYNRSVSGLGAQQKDALRTAGYLSADKPHVFVAMPFADTMDDVFHYGIQGAVKAAGFLCERADLTSFVGDIVEWVKQRISTATFVIADLTTANPNVYLEVGYAWGRGRPTILVARDTAELKFDVKGQRCLIYKSIKQLEDLLGKELSAMAGPKERGDSATRKTSLSRLTAPTYKQLAILVLDGSGSMGQQAHGGITKAQAVNRAVRGLFTYFRHSRLAHHFSFAVITFDEQDRKSVV